MGVAIQFRVSKVIQDYVHGTTEIFIKQSMAFYRGSKTTTCSLLWCSLISYLSMNNLAWPRNLEEMKREDTAEDIAVRCSVKEER